MREEYPVYATSYTTYKVKKISAFLGMCLGTKRDLPYLPNLVQECNKCEMAESV